MTHTSLDLPGHENPWPNRHVAARRGRFTDSYPTVGPCALVPLSPPRPGRRFKCLRPLSSIIPPVQNFTPSILCLVLGVYLIFMHVPPSHNREM